ncbi:MAG TPA: threonine--tRNA ligase [Candidatus Paceibacterota bacterium]|nr:threonine--tRNA ligase [Candidatus Paceibacterota bacterium]HPT18379.1 threonine--tRNA ligase [Candidatus Paceibacterota bacterium]
MEKEDKLHNLRHSLAHLLAAAVLELYPDTKNTIGPSVEDGFYYDFEFSSPISDKDLPKIEKKMREILKSWKEFNHEEKIEQEAKEYFKENEYKIELINDILNKGEKITFYTCGKFTDLCRGGHVENPAKEISPDSFKLDRVAGAYWRGDEKNKMLTRIYGLAFENKENLEQYLEIREEAKKRDHKKIGKELGLFTISNLVGKGLPMYLPKGNIIRTELENFIRKEKENLGYSFVTIPHIAKKELYIKSGHMGKYDAMMPTMTDENGEEFVMKAMNCPHHFEIYNAEPHSYRDLPLRIAENTTVYRNEKSGELAGLLRVKNLTQDDTHHFVTQDQIESEIEMIFGLMKKVYSIFGFNDYKVEISVRDINNKAKYFGSDDVWEKAENILIESAKKMGLQYSVEEGEAAFYGPKIDIKVKDSIGRNWQLTTIQLDFNQPENFEMDYMGEDGRKHRVVVLHVAILGSFERFMGILIEHYAGSFPVWLSPIQVAIVPVRENHRDEAKKLYSILKQSSIRTEIFESDDSLGKRIHNAKDMKTPFVIVLGDKEVSSGTLTIENRDGTKLENISLQEFIEKIQKLITDKK